MKQVIITTGKATILVVDCKPNSEVRDEGKFYSLLPVAGKGFYPSKKNYKLIGSPSQVTEEHWKGIVDNPTIFIDQSYNPLLNKEMIRYNDYQSEENMWCTATESGLSLLKANGVYESWSNPQIFVNI